MLHVSRTFVFSLLALGLISWRLVRALNVWSKSRPKLAWLVVWLVAVLPMSTMTYFVAHYGVNTPTFDDWEMAPLIVKAHTHHLTFADLFQQQQEGRTVLPKLIFILSSYSGHWDVREQMMISVVSCWLTAAGIFVLLRRSGLGFWSIAVCFWLSALTIFSLAQYEIWIFASGFPSFWPALFLVIALLADHDKLSLGSKFAICAVLALASSFTLPHGLLAWGLTFPFLLASRPTRTWWQWLVAWLGLALLCAVGYFWGYEKPSYLPEFAPHVSLLHYLRFLLLFLGGELAYMRTPHAGGVVKFLGALLLLLFSLSLIYFARHLREASYRQKFLPWLALGFYAIASGCLATFGRVGFGTHYALSSRYVTFSLYLTIAVIALLAIMQADLLTRFASRKFQRAITAGWLTLIAAYLLAYTSTASNTFHFLLGYAANDRVSRGATQLSQVLDTSAVLQRVSYPPDPHRVVTYAKALDDLAQLRPPLLQQSNLTSLFEEHASSLAEGSCEKIAPLGKDLIEATGWALLKNKGRQPDCVVLAYQLRTQPLVPFAISEEAVFRADIAKRKALEQGAWTGWTARYQIADIPPGADVSFWACDADDGRFYKLADHSDLARKKKPNESSNFNEK